MNMIKEHESALEDTPISPCCNTAMLSAGYAAWVSPSNDIIAIPADTEHLDYAMAHPELFGEPAETGDYDSRRGVYHDRGWHSVRVMPGSVFVAGRKPRDALSALLSKNRLDPAASIIFDSGGTGRTRCETFSVSDFMDGSARPISGSAISGINTAVNNSWVLGVGYWVSPAGVPYPVDTDHDTYVSQNSDLFGAVSEEEAIGKGWCRVRFHRQGLEIDLASDDRAASPQNRVSSILTALRDKGIALQDKSVNVGMGNLPGVSLTMTEAIEGSWDVSG